jgi:hypothetical protein
MTCAGTTTAGAIVLTRWILVARVAMVIAFRNEHKKGNVHPTTGHEGAEGE